MIRRLVPLLLASALVLLPACSDPSGTASTTETSDTSSAATELLDFEAPRLGGGTVRGVDYAGSDLAIWFWAPW